VYTKLFSSFRLYFQVLQTKRELNFLEKGRTTKQLSAQDQISQVCLACMHVDASETPLKHDAQICKKLNVQSEVVVDKSTNDLVVQSEKENVPASIDSDLKQQQPTQRRKRKRKAKSILPILTNLQNKTSMMRRLQHQQHCNNNNNKLLLSLNKTLNLTTKFQG